MWDGHVQASLKLDIYIVVIMDWTGGLLLVHAFQDECMHHGSQAGLHNVDSLTLKTVSVTVQMMLPT